MLLLNSLAFFGFVIFAGVASGACPNNYYLTTQQKFAVAKLREFLKNEPTKAYMLSDYWLVNWLKTKQFNEYNTFLAIKQYLQLRTDQNLDNILKEDWSDMRARFPYFRNISEKCGKPVLYLDMSQWDMSSYLTHKEATDRLIRYTLMASEESEVQVRQLRAEGRGITQYDMLFNIGGFDLGKHACIQCTSFYWDTTHLLSGIRAANVEKAVFVNVPHLFKAVYYLFSGDTRKFIHLYGQDQVEVAKVLNEYIGRDQIPRGIFSQVVGKDNSESFMVWDKEL